MRDIRSVLSLLVVTATAIGAASAAPPRSSGGSHQGAGLADHVPQIDGALSTLPGPDGRVWAAWSYRAAGEFDIALASRGTDGVWTSPTFLGRRNASDEVDPVLAIDVTGSIYVAFATRSPAQVAVAIRRAGSDRWSDPVVVSGIDSASDPAIRILGDRLVVAYRTARGTALVDLPIVHDGARTRGIQDGPDGVDPLGVTGAPDTSGGNGGGHGGGGDDNGQDEDK